MVISIGKALGLFNNSKSARGQASLKGEVGQVKINFHQSARERD